MIRRIGILLLGGVLGGCLTPSPSPLPPAHVRLEMIGGFRASHAPVPAGRVALLVDSTASMLRLTEAGASRLRAARTAAQRFAERLSSDTDLELFVLGNDRSAGCNSLPTNYADERGELIDRAGRLLGWGKGSLTTALDAFASPAEGGFERVVAITALGDECGGDLCQAIQGLAERDIRLDLVLIGGAEAPACAEGPRGVGAELPLPGRSDAPVAFSVESVGADPAVLVCSEVGGLPVRVAPGAAAVVVQLDPPLRIVRNFKPGTRWVLQVLDFPSLDPPERRWRWKAGAPVAEGQETR